MLCISCGVDVGDTIRLCDSCQAKEDESIKEKEFAEPPSDRFRRSHNRSGEEHAEQLKRGREQPGYDEQAENVKFEEPSITKILMQPLPLALGGIVAFMLFALLVVLLRPGAEGITIVGLFLLGLGSLIALICGFILLVFSFQQSIWWGLAYIFIPFAGLVFIILYWDICRRAFWAALIGHVLFFSGAGLWHLGAMQEQQVEPIKIKKTHSVATSGSSVLSTSLF